MLCYNCILPIFCATYIFYFIKTKNKTQVYVKSTKKQTIYFYNKFVLGVVFY